MNGSRLISIVVPVYNNGKTIEKMFFELKKVEFALLKKNVCVEYIFVDDGSVDNSLQLIQIQKNKVDNLKLIKLARNFGAVKCSKTGLKFVNGDAFVILAADLQDPPSLILEMAEKWLEGSKFVICERISRSDPFSSKIFSKIYYWFIRKFIFSDFPKGGYDLSLMDRVFLPYLVNSSKSAYTPILAFWLGIKPERIPYHRNQRSEGKSGWTFSKRVKAFSDVFFGFSIFPIRLISAIGFLVALLSFIYGSWIFFNALISNIKVQGFATLVILISFLLGLVLVMLGILGEYLWRIFEDTNKRPEVMIEEIF